MEILPPGAFWDRPPPCLCSPLATLSLVSGVCLLSGLGTDLAHIASPSQEPQVCAQLIPKVTLSHALSSHRCCLQMRSPSPSSLRPTRCWSMEKPWPSTTSRGIWRWSFPSERCGQAGSVGAGRGQVKTQVSMCSKNIKKKIRCAHLQ